MTKHAKFLEDTSALARCISGMAAGKSRPPVCQRSSTTSSCVGQASGSSWVRQTREKVEGISRSRKRRGEWSAYIRSPLRKRHQRTPPRRPPIEGIMAAGGTCIPGLVFPRSGSGLFDAPYFFQSLQSKIGWRTAIPTPPPLAGAADDCRPEKWRGVLTTQTDCRIRIATRRQQAFPRPFPLSLRSISVLR